MKNLKFAMWLGFILIWGCARTPVYKSTWQQPSFGNDATNTSWSDGMLYDTESGIMYELSNDSKLLYVKMKFPNQVLQRKIISTGLTFWIDTTAKKKKQMGLTFPVKSKPNGMVGEDNFREINKNKRPGSERNIDTLKFNAKYREGIESMLLTNYFGNGRTDLIDNRNNEGINAILRFDKENILCYEAEISLTKIFPNLQRFQNDTTQYFSFGIETGKMELPSRGNGGGPPQMGTSGGRGGGGMGGMGGGGGPPSGSPGGSGMDSDKMAMMKAMSEESKVWVKKACLTGSRE